MVRLCALLVKLLNPPGHLPRGRVRIPNIMPSCHTPCNTHTTEESRTTLMLSDWGDTHPARGLSPVSSRPREVGGG